MQGLCFLALLLLLMRIQLMLNSSSANNSCFSDAKCVIGVVDVWRDATWPGAAGTVCCFPSAAFAGHRLLLACWQLVVTPAAFLLAAGRHTSELDNLDNFVARTVKQRVLVT